MPHLTAAVANEFIKLAGASGISHMKLQKLVYLAHEDYVRRHGGEPLVEDSPEVWQYGPVFSWLYHSLKHYRNEPIRQPIEIFDIVPKVEDHDALKSIRDTWAKFQNASAVYLSDLTHRPGSPWRNIAERHNFNVPRGLAITPSDILSASA